VTAQGHADGGIAERLRVAREVAARAGDFLLAYRRDRMEVLAKGAQDFVTEADRAVEAMIREAVARHFPGDDVLGEEGGGSAAPSLWVVDPIDGTINFIRSLPAYAVSIAYVRDGRTEAGVVHIPLLRETHWATRGGGAFCNGERSAVSDCRDLARARVAAGYAQRGSKAEHLRFVGRLLRQGVDIIKVNSAAVCLAMTAAGRIDGYYERELMSWDVLAGLLLVREAGGVTNDFGQRGLLEKDFAFACGAGLEAPLRALAKV
jgi:myo-inositol-1(or 4)-monophosphatase